MRSRFKSATKGRRSKKHTAVLLSLAMILGMMPGITKPLEVQAATTNVAPTPSQFAKRADLMTK